MATLRAQLLRAHVSRLPVIGPVIEKIYLLDPVLVEEMLEQFCKLRGIYANPVARNPRARVIRGDGSFALSKDEIKQLFKIVQNVLEARAAIATAEPELYQVLLQVLALRAILTQEDLGKIAAGIVDGQVALRAAQFDHQAKMAELDKRHSHERWMGFGGATKGLLAWLVVAVAAYLIWSALFPRLASDLRRHYVAPMNQEGVDVSVPHWQRIKDADGNPSGIGKPRPGYYYEGMDTSGYRKSSVPPQ